MNIEKIVNIFSAAMFLGLLYLALIGFAILTLTCLFAIPQELGWIPRLYVRMDIAFTADHVRECIMMTLCCGAVTGFLSWFTGHVERATKNFPF